MGRVIVIGAGISGVSAAIWLQRSGRDVALIDRQAPGEGASFGNAGVLAACSVVPVTTPGLPLKAPGYVLNPNFPVYVIWRRLPHIMPWLFRYLCHANDRDTRRIASGLAKIVSDSVLQHKDLATGTGAEKWLRDSYYYFAYQSREHFQQDRYVWTLRREAGFVPEEIKGADVQDAVPGLSQDIGFLAACSAHGFVRNPGQYVKDLANSFANSGGSLIKTSVRDFELSDGRIAAVSTDSGRFECTEAVLAAGIWSRKFMARLGISVPMESERGYHVLFRNPGIELDSPVMIASGKFVATSMSEGLRCAGVAEFGGVDPPSSAAPLDLIRRKAAESFPGLATNDCETWLGHRPAPCDSLPLIGEIRKTGVFAAFGHHHIGLTSGPKTGRLVAKVLAGGHPGLDISPYSPDRFSR